MKGKNSLKIVVLLIIFLLLGIKTSQANEAIYAPSIFEANQLESSLRICVENTLFTLVLQERASDLEGGEELDFLNTKLESSQEILVNEYQKIYDYFHSDSDNDNKTEIIEIYDEKKTIFNNNEVEILSFLVESLKDKQEELINLEEIMIEQEDSSYLFYQAFLDELIRLLNLFPDVPSQILTFDENEIQGYNLPEGTVALTFDDGPTPITVDILDTLAENEVEASFFVLGSRLLNDDNQIDEAKVDILSEILETGSDLALHSLTHSNLIGIEDRARLREELARPKEIVEDYLDYEVEYFRAPYGSRNNDVLAEVYNYYDYHILWNIDSQDWASQFSEEIIKERVIRLVHLYNGGIVLFHDTNWKSANILADLINSLKASQFEFKNISSVLN